VCELCRELAAGSSLQCLSSAVDEQASVCQLFTNLATWLHACLQVSYQNWPTVILSSGIIILGTVGICYLFYFTVI